MQFAAPIDRLAEHVWHNKSKMSRPVEITTSFPSLFETAKQLGVSKKDAKMLAELAKRSAKTGEFDIPGVGRLIREPVGSAKKRRKHAVTFRVSKAVNDDANHRLKK